MRGYWRAFIEKESTQIENPARNDHGRPHLVLIRPSRLGDTLPLPAM